jgi:hypothetical protein
MENESQSAASDFCWEGPASRPEFPESRNL